MVERYPSTIGYFRGPGKTAEPQSYPIGDFLGPDLVIWTTDPNAQMPTTPLRAPAQSGVVTALLIGTSTFSTRIGVVPLSNEELAARRRVDAQSPGQAQQDVFLGGYDGGHITLTVDEPLGSAAYNALRQQTAAHPNVWMNVMANPYMAAPVGSPVPAPPPNGLQPPPEPYRVEERFPPLPLYGGFNVFGPLEQVLFSGVYGHVTVGASPLDLSGSVSAGAGNGSPASANRETTSAATVTFPALRSANPRAASSAPGSGCEVLTRARINLRGDELVAGEHALQRAPQSRRSRCSRSLDDAPLQRAEAFQLELIRLDGRHSLKAACLQRFDQTHAVIVGEAFEVSERIIVRADRGARFGKAGLTGAYPPADAFSLGFARALRRAL
jgi:hypothetical protein